VRRFIALAVSSAFLLAAAVLAPQSSSAASMSLDVETMTLPNGMTVVLYEDHSLPKVVVNTWFHVGSKDERPGRSGFAHLFEHLMFMGTNRAPDSEYDLILEEGGAWSNASTSSDRTNYYVVGPAHLLPTFLWLEADRLAELDDAMTQEKLDAQRDVVRNERRESENEPYGKADMLLDETIFPEGHPYAHPVIGSHEDLEAATVDDVVDFFRTYYVPGNATMVIAGDFDSDEVRPIVERTLGALPARSTPEHRRAEAPVLTSEIRRVETDKVEFPRLTVIWISPAYHRDGDGAMDLAGNILGDGPASRLERTLIHDLELAQNVAVYQYSKELNGLFVVEAIATPGADLGRIKSVVLDELDAFVAEGPTEDELARVRAQLEAGFLRQMESLPSRADRLNMYQHYYGEPDSFERDLARWRSPTAEDVRAWAAKVFGPGRLDLRVYPEGAAVDAASLDERPANFEAQPYTPPTVETFTLSNGIDVHAVVRPATGLFAGRCIVKGGECQVDDARAGLDELTGQVMNAGAGGKGPSEFADAVDRLGASITAIGGRSHLSVAVNGMANRFEETLDLYADLILRPNLTDADVAREKSLQLAGIAARGDDPTGLVSIVSAAMMFDDADPRHRPFAGTAETVSALGPDDVRAHYHDVLRPDQATFVFVGDFEVATLKKALESRFRKWKAVGDRPAMVPLALRDAAPRLVLVDRPDAPQTVIRATRAVDRLEGAERMERYLASEVLGGTFTSRLNTNLRERNGYTYGAWCFVGDAPEYSYRMAQSNVFTDVTGAALTEMRTELNRLATDPPTEAELRKARESHRTTYIDAAQTTGSLVGTLATSVMNGRSIDSLDRDLATLRSLSDDAILASAKSGGWNWDGLDVILVGDARKVLPQLKEAGFPEPEIVNELGQPVEEMAGTE
jgi:predicted Zn-dependent peptidase